MHDEALAWLSVTYASSGPLLYNRRAVELTRLSS